MNIKILLMILWFFTLVGCSTLKSVKDCGMVVEPYTMQQKDDRWECRTYNWFWD